jgi:hypothetical protein
MQQRTPIRLKGIVIAAAWEKNGEISAVDIAGYDEKRYRVVDDLMGRRLRQFIHKKLIVDGVVDSTTNGEIIYVERFHFDK